MRPHYSPIYLADVFYLGSKPNLFNSLFTSPPPKTLVIRKKNRSIELKIDRTKLVNPIETDNDTRLISSYPNAISSNLFRSGHGASFHVNDNLTVKGHTNVVQSNGNNSISYFFHRIESLVRLIHFQFCRYYSSFFCLESTFVYNSTT